MTDLFREMLNGQLPKKSNKKKPFLFKGKYTILHEIKKS